MKEAEFSDDWIEVIIEFAWKYDENAEKTENDERKTWNGHEMASILVVLWAKWI